MQNAEDTDEIFEELFNKYGKVLFRRNDQKPPIADVDDDAESLSWASGTLGIFHNFYPFYIEYAQSSQAHGYGVHYLQMVQYPYLPQNYGTMAILSTTTGDYYNRFSKFI